MIEIPAAGSRELAAGSRELVAGSRELVLTRGKPRLSYATLMKIVRR
jgi:hypothetical protein